MSVYELLGITGVVTAAAGYGVARSIALFRRRAAIRPAGRSSVSQTTFRDTYVSETTPAYFQYVRRRYRYAVHCPVRYVATEQSGEGVVVDMTREGWRVRGQAGMRRGMILTMDLSLSSPDGVVAVPRAVVCWVRGVEFGVKLEAVDSRPAEALSEFFSRLSPNTVFTSRAA